MNLRNSFNKYRARYYASGSPFRYLRKGFLYASRPIDAWQRISTAAAGRELAPDLRARLDSLKSSGHADAVEDVDPVLLAELERFCDERLAQTPDLRKKMTAYWANLTGPADRTVDGILIRFALQERVLKLATAYFGQVPYLADVDISVSFDTGKPQWETSQLWHRDYADHKTVKFWVYLSDVLSKGDGPFTYVPPGPSRRIKNTFFPGRVKDETMAKCVAPDEVKEIFGKRGSAFYVEPARCYHLGSRLSPGRQRITYVATFLTRNSLPCSEWRAG